MRHKFSYNENFVVFAKKHVGGNGNLIINFAWPKLKFEILFSFNMHACANYAGFRWEGHI